LKSFMSNPEITTMLKNLDEASESAPHPNK